MKFIQNIVAPILAAVAIFALIQGTVASFKVFHSSMLPNIQPGEYIMVSKAAYFFRSPERGEVIVFHSPQNPNSDLIKRIIALPGDTVEIKDNKVFVNDIPLNEAYPAEPPNYIFPYYEIPAGNYFVLGDNRNHSIDSHKGWTVPREDIVGKVWFTYWPPQKWRLIEHYTLNVDEQTAKLSRDGHRVGMLVDHTEHNVWQISQAIFLPLP